MTFEKRMRNLIKKAKDVRIVHPENYQYRIHCIARTKRSEHSVIFDKRKKYFSCTCQGRSAWNVPVCYHIIAMIAQVKHIPDEFKEGLERVME